MMPRRLGDFAIGLDEAAEVAAETILVELVAGLTSQRRQLSGRDLVGDDDAHHVAFIEPAALDLEVDQLDADAHEQAGEEVVDADGQRHDVVEFLRAWPSRRR